MKFFLKTSPQYEKNVSILMLVLITVLTAPLIFGHAKLLRSQPADRQALAQTPPAVELFFNKPLRQTTINSVIVTDSSGARIDRERVVLAEDGKTLRVEIAETGAGMVTVEWKALSADDHLIKGKFTFRITEEKTTKPAPSDPLNDSAPTDAAPTATENHTNQTPALTAAKPLQSFVRWFQYLAVLLLFGGFSFLLLVLQPSLQRAPHLTAEEKTRALRLAAVRFRRLAWLCLGIIFISAFSAIVLQAAAVLETTIAQALQPANWQRILWETGALAPFGLQIGAALGIGAILFLNARFQIAEKENKKKGGGTILLWVGLIASGGMLATLSLTGHARAAQKDYWFALLSDWTHLLAAGVWVGGIFHLALTLPKCISALTDLKRFSVLSRLIPRFSGLAVAATLLLALTGIINSWIHLTDVRHLISLPYGITLLVKIILFLVMLPIGGFNSFVLRPRLAKLVETMKSDESSSAVKDFYFVVGLEAAFAAVVLLLASILAFLPHSQDHHAANKSCLERANAESVSRGLPEKKF